MPLLRGTDQFGAYIRCPEEADYPTAIAIGILLIRDQFETPHLALLIHPLVDHSFLSGGGETEKYQCEAIHCHEKIHENFYRPL